MSTLIKELLLISAKDFEKWLKAHYFKKHRLLEALQFNYLEKERFTCRYITPKPPIIAFKIETEPIIHDVIRVKILPLDHPVSDPNAVLDYASEMIASVIEEEFEPPKQFKNKSLERQFMELGILELGEQGEENIIQFLLKRHEAQQKQAGKEALFEIRCKYLAAKGSAAIIQRLVERRKTRELELPDVYMRDNSKQVHQEKETDKIVSNSITYGPHLDTEEKIERLRKYRKKLKLKGELRRTFTRSCQLVGIDPKTVKKHAPKLRQHWENQDF